MKNLLKIGFLSVVLSVAVSAQQSRAVELSSELQGVLNSQPPLELPAAISGALLAIEDQDSRQEQAAALGSQLARERGAMVSSVAKTLVTLDATTAIEFGTSASKQESRLARDTFEAVLLAAPESSSAVFAGFMESNPEFAGAFVAIAAQAPAEALFSIADTLAQMEEGKTLRGQALGNWVADRIDSKLSVVDKRSRILDQLIVFQTKVKLVQERYSKFETRTQALLGPNTFGNMAELIARQVIRVDLFDQSGESIETAFLEPESLVAPAFVSEVPVGEAFAADALLSQIANDLVQSARTSNTLINPNAGTNVNREGRQLSRDAATNIVP